MDRTLQLLRSTGWRLVSVAGDHAILEVDPLDIGRVPAHLERVFLPHGAVFHEGRPPCATPCAWVEFDVATRRAWVHVVINDSWLDRT